jgi:hypothetical protein
MSKDKILHKEETLSQEEQEKIEQAAIKSANNMGKPEWVKYNGVWYRTTSAEWHEILKQLKEENV